MKGTVPGIPRVPMNVCRMEAKGLGGEPCPNWPPGWVHSWILWCSSSPTSPTLAPSLQTELSLQKEQLQLKIIEIEDEAEKWQKEKDRIKVGRLHASALLWAHPTCPTCEEPGLAPIYASCFFWLLPPLWPPHQFPF